MTPTTPLRRKLQSAAIALYLLVQLWLPLPRWWAGFHQTEGAFSWNMFAHHYECEWGYTIQRLDGRTESVDLREHVTLADSAWRAFHRDALPSFHAWVCENVVRPGGGGRFTGRMRCALVPGEPVDLVRAGADLCHAPNHGVMEAPE